MSAFCLSSVISSSVGSLSAQLLSSLIASVADESGDAENKKENDYRNPRTDGDPFHYAEREWIYPHSPSCILLARLQHSVQLNQQSAFAVIGKLQCAEGLPFF